MRVVAAVLGALMVACSPDASPPPEATSSPGDSAAPASAAPGDSVPAGLECGEFMEDALRVVPTRAALARDFGAPDSVRAWTEPNRHIPDVPDSLFDVRYAGLFVHIRKPHGGQDMPDLAQVSDNRFLRRADIGMGSAAERVVTVLGEPAERSDAMLRYVCGEAGAPLTFTLARGAVTGIELDYYVD